MYVNYYRISGHMEKTSSLKMAQNWSRSISE